MSFSLAFSPNLIAAELAAMNDPGFVSPVARYEQLMELLLAFYSPGDGKQPTLARALFVAHKAIIRDQSRTNQDIQEQMTAAIEEFWLQERRKHGNRTACGESLEAVRPCIKEYARYYYRVIFQEMARGEPKLLQHRFRSLVRGCEAVYREHLRKAGEHQGE